MATSSPQSTSSQYAVSQHSHASQRGQLSPSYAMTNSPQPHPTPSHYTVPQYTYGALTGQPPMPTGYIMTHPHGHPALPQHIHHASPPGGSMATGYTMTGSSQPPHQVPAAVLSQHYPGHAYPGTSAVGYNYRPQVMDARMTATGW